jgi:DNA-binding IclR family transcriptional regulator
MASRNLSADVSSSSDIRAVSRAADVLSLFGAETQELTASEVGEKIGLNRTTAYRYCNSLLSVGLLERGTQPASFIPGGALLRLGAFALGRRRVMDLAAPYMRQVAHATDATAVLSLWTPTGPVVSRVEENAVDGSVVTVRVGTQLPLISAQGVTFLAFLSDQMRVARILAMLSDYERDRAEKEAEMARRDGYRFMTSRRGITAISAPVFDEFGCCAAMAIIGTTEMLPASSNIILNELISGATALSTEMGGRSYYSASN